MTRPLQLIIANIILSLSFTAFVTAGPLEDAIDAAVKKGDDATAVRLFRELANQRNAYGQFNLGGMYAAGLGVQQDYSEALKWRRLAADQGHAYAQVNVGDMYANGQGVPQDYSEAVKWYRLAADQDLSYAQYNLGKMYADGRGVPQDYVRAHLWFNLAASQDNQSAAEGRDEAARHLTSVQIAEVQKLAREWKPSKQSPR
jgi:uncharacterized protein